MTADHPSRYEAIAAFHTGLFAAASPEAAPPPDADSPDTDSPGASPPGADWHGADWHGTDWHGAGPAWRIAGWGSADLQRVRFEALLRTSGYRGGSVLDWGCGPADLYFFLRDTDLPLRYTGVDLDPRMVELASSRGAPGVSLLPAGAMPEGTYDYVFASGIFQFQDPSDPLYYLLILEHAYDISSRAVAANFLSAERPDEAKAADELYADPSVLARFAAAVTPRWVLDHGYHPRGADFTVALLHEPPGVTGGSGRSSDRS
ncbi:class I SAM-dependent methyltransferase [Dactylosporangium sp. NPDC051485]|uniref:class I SAM-dependent methyltransferase n=1 Tax=Dactylosporangium sp. NPDC051485 TaxID=3154846 RepID=UPI00342CBBBB